jgi:hypothetical protein
LRRQFPGKLSQSSATKPGYFSKIARARNSPKEGLLITALLQTGKYFIKKNQKKIIEAVYYLKKTMQQKQKIKKCCIKY